MKAGQKQIEIIVSGGAVQDVFGVPDGWDVVIKDYDVGEDEDSDIETDDDGCEFIRMMAVSLWGGH